MLPNNIFLYNTAQVSGNVWTADAYFQNTANAKFTKVGDFIKTSSGSIFVVDSWVGYPNFYADGAKITMTERTRNNDLVDDIGYNTVIYTPNLRVGKPTYAQTEIYILSATRLAGNPYSFATELYFYVEADKSKIKVGDWVTIAPQHVLQVAELVNMEAMYPVVNLVDVNYSGMNLGSSDAVLTPSSGEYSIPVPARLLDPQMRQALQETQMYLLDSIVPAKIRKPEYFVGETLPLGSLVYLDPVTQELKAATSVSSGGFTVIGALDTDCDFGDYSTVTSNGLFRNTNWNFLVENIGSEVCLSIANPGELVLLSDIDEESLNPGDIVQTIGTIVGPDVLDINLGIKIYK